MTRSRHAYRRAALAALSALLLAGPLSVAGGAAQAQERPGGFLDNLFSRGEPPQSQEVPPPRDAASGVDSNDTGARINRIENALRQLTGRVEQLQHENQQLRMQLQQMGTPGSSGAAPRNGAAVPGQRSDVFNPAAQPNAPGAPRPLGSQAAGPSMSAPMNAQMGSPMTAPMGAPDIGASDIGAPNGRDAGAPLDLNSLAGTGPSIPAPGQQSGQSPAPPRSTSGVQLATLPPSATPKDQYDLGYGYVLHKDYGLAEQTFKNFLRKYPEDALAPEAQYWLGESQFQQQRYRDAAEAFLAVSTKHERSSKAPDALLRLGQSLAAMQQKEAACATLAEVGRKFPRASAGVKRGVAQEQKRAHC